MIEPTGYVLNWMRPAASVKKRKVFCPIINVNAATLKKKLRT